MFKEIAEKYKKPEFSKFTIMASNEIQEDALYDLQKSGHEVDSFGIGTNLITCLKQPALGMVYKLVSINGVPRIKLSEDFDKMTLPGLKSVYRIYIKDPSKPSFDLIALREEPEPQEGHEITVIDSNKPKETFKFVPIRVELLNPLGFDGRVLHKPLSIKESHKLIYEQLDTFNPEILVKKDPVKYMVYFSPNLFKLVETLVAQAKA